MKLGTQDIRNSRNLAARHRFGFAPVVGVRSAGLTNNTQTALLIGHQVANFILVLRVEEKEEKARRLSSVLSPKPLVLLLRRLRGSCAGKPAHDPHSVRCSTPTTSP